MACVSSPPGQITEVGHDPAAVDAFLRPRAIGLLYGVGPVTAGTLARHGVHTAPHPATPPWRHRRPRRPYPRSRPRPRPVTPHSPSPSLSADRLFSQDELDPDQHRRALLSTAEQLGTQLRERREVCRTLTLTVRYADRTSTTKTRTLPEATSHSTALARAAYDLHATLGLQRARVRAIALRAHGLSPAEHAHHQLTLDPADDKARRIEAAADRARVRFGPAAVTPQPWPPPETGIALATLRGSAVPCGSCPIETAVRTGVMDAGVLALKDHGWASVQARHPPPRHRACRPSRQVASTDGTVSTMPGMNVPFEDDELTAVNAAAAAAGVSARQFIKDATLDKALAKRNQFLEAALSAYDYTRAAFAEVCPDDVEPRTVFLQDEDEAARLLAALDESAHGTAA
jgi:hypothetical protein